MMRPLLFTAALTAAVSLTYVPLASQAKNGSASSASPVVVLTTVRGVIEIEMLPADAPKSVARVVDLSKQGFYRGTRFHWVQPNVAQVGDQYTRDMTKRDLWGTGGSGLRQAPRPVGVAEFAKRAFNRGVVGLYYRQGYKPEQADCQIFIIKQPSPGLNGKYAAVGRVIKGMDVVDKIKLDDMIKDVGVR